MGAWLLTYDDGTRHLLEAAGTKSQQIRVVGVHVEAVRPIVSAKWRPGLRPRGPWLYLQATLAFLGAIDAPDNVEETGSQ